jgi:hypothetical protein
MKFINYTCKFFICIIVSEISELKKNIEYFKYLFLNVNLLNYIFYLFKKTTNPTNPIKSKIFAKFLYLNQVKWKKIDRNSNNKDSTILIESFINQQFNAVTNIMIGKYLQFFTNTNCIGLIRAGDIKGRLLFRSFGIKKIYEYKFGSFLTRSNYIFKSIKILYSMKNVKDFCNVELDGIDIGLLSYDTWIRYTKIPSSKKIDIRLILFFAKALHASYFFDELYKKNKIKKLVQSEKQFIPHGILFQKSLKNNIEVYARNGVDNITIKIYTEFNQRHEPKNRFSEKLLSAVFKQNKKKAVKEIDLWFKSQKRSKIYGKSWAPFVTNNEKVVSVWQKKTDGPEELKKKSYKKTLQISDLKEITKAEFCKNLGWRYDKKIVVVFLPYMIDGVYQNGKKNLYLDNYSWIIGTLKIIKDIKNVNWIIREHPQEIRYGTKSNYPIVLNNILKKNLHIKNCPININPTCLTKIADIALTCNGSAGLEYQSFGIPSIIAEKSPYSHFGFKNIPKNIYEYKNLLKKIHLIKKPSIQEIQKAKVILFTCYILSLTNASFLPDHLPQFETRMMVSDEEHFWSQIIKKNKKFNFENDPFKKMFKNQIELKNKHTINFNKFNFKKKNFNDYYG